MLLQKEVEQRILKDNQEYIQANNLSNIAGGSPKQEAEAKAAAKHFDPLAAAESKNFV
jgi:hypothetical protein